MTSLATAPEELDPPGAVTGAELRRAMGRFPTGLAVITSRDGAGAPVGTTINSITSVSLDPPLVLACLGSASLTLAAIRGHGAFAINLLAAEHRAAAGAFGRRGSQGA